MALLPLLQPSCCCFPFCFWNTNALPLSNLDAAAAVLFATFLLPEGIGLQLRGEAEEGGEAGLGPVRTGLSPGGAALLGCPEGTAPAAPLHEMMCSY